MVSRSLIPLLALAAGLAAGPAAAAPNFKLKKGAEGKLCLECHAGQLDEVLKRPFVHTPVRSRECTGCHNPHASDHGKLLGGEPSKACLACHQVVPSGARSRHRPIEEKGCTCHEPHAASSSTREGRQRPVRQLPQGGRRGRPGDSGTSPSSRRAASPA
jgi:predicted CXXCH cytochrome family protein